MNLKKQIPGISSGSNSTRVVVGLLACLAAGALLGVLLAPESGEDTRKKISRKAKDLADDVEDKLQSLKDKFRTHAEELEDLKEQVTAVARSKARTAANDLSEAKQAAINKARSRVKEASDDANDAVQGI